MRLVAPIIAALLIASSATAGQSVMLRPDAIDEDGIVTLADLFEGAGAAGQVKVAARNGQITVLDAGLVQGLARRNGLDWANAEGVRRIVVRGEAVDRPPSARGNVEVLTYARSLAVGEIVQPEDLVWAKAAAAPADSPSDADQAIGLATRRPLRAGAVVSMRDITAPQVIKAGDLVTVTFISEGLSLALQGKAMASAAQGENVAVLNTSSKKIIQAVASGPGQAIIGPYAQQSMPTGPARLALR